MKKSDQNKVVITGMGVISPYGIGNEVLLKNIKESKTGIKQRKQNNNFKNHNLDSFKSKFVANIDNYYPTDFLTEREISRMDRFSQLAVISSKLAIEDSKIQLNKIPDDRISILIGTAVGGLADAEADYQQFFKKNRAKANLGIRIFGGAAHANVSISLGLNCPANTVSNSCASSNVAFGNAFNMIKTNQANVVIVGGVEAPLSPLIYSAFDTLGVLSGTKIQDTDLDNNILPCKAFDKDRNGFILGEGSAFFIFENLDHAKKRKSKIYAEMKGFGMCSEAYHMCKPEPSGKYVEKAMQLALNNGFIKNELIDYINAHGSTTIHNDKNEANAIYNLFYKNKQKKYEEKKPYFSSTKGYTGHLLGAAGAIELAICLQAINYSFVPHTLGLDNPDPFIIEKGLNVVKKNHIYDNITNVMSNSFGFGGVNTSLVLSKYDN